MGMEGFIVGSDLHGDRQDKVAVRGFLRHVDDFKPKHRIFAGDIFDFRAIRVGADKEEKRHSLQADFNAGMDFLKKYQPTVITLGNHDQRLWDIVQKDGLRKTGPLVDLAEIFIQEFEALTLSLKTLVLPYDKRKGVWKHNGLKVVHGFDGLDPANMASMYGDVLYGHGHGIESAFAPRDGEAPEARMIGCLCRKDMTYNRAQTKTLRQQHGWAYGAFLGRNRNAVLQTRVQYGQVAYAGDLKVISA